MLGTAWPAMRRGFAESVGGLGWVLLVTTAGAVAIATVVGSLIRRLGVPALLAVAGGVAALGATAYAVAPGLWLLLTVAPLMGAAPGLMDGGLNTAIGITGRGRLLNLLHGSYGIGTTIGPLLVTVMIVAGSWRAAYLVLVATDLVAAAAWWAYRRRPPSEARSTSKTPSSQAGDTTPSGEADGAGEAEAMDRPDPTGGWSSRRLAVALMLGMVVFFVYTGLEVGAAQWETSFTRGHLGLSASAAGVAAFGFWAALTAARIGLALLARPPAALTVIRWGVIGSLVATGVIWWQPNPAVSVIGFVALGAALAGVFPALVSVTPNRFGTRRAQHAIAWQVGAAAAGGSGISALIGLLISVTSLAVLGPTLLSVAILLVVTSATLGRLAPARGDLSRG
jgi:fucose permease